MANAFDRFDTETAPKAKTGNPFDAFDDQSAGNPFDAFDDGAAEQPAVETEQDAAPSMNMARGAVERGGDLLGGLFTAADAVADWADKKHPLGGLVWEDGIVPDYKGPDEYAKWRSESGGDEPLQTAADRWKNLDIGYVENHTWDKVKQEFSEGGALSGSAWAEVMAYGAEQGVKSIPDMVAAMTVLPAYVVARSGEIGEERAKNKGKEEADLTDVLEAAPAALGSAILERIGAKGITQAGAEAVGKEALQQGLGKLAKEGAKAGSKEAATEFVQEGIIEYLGGKLGTDAAMSVWEALDRGAAGAVAGGVYGTGAGVGGAAVNQVRNRKQGAETPAGEAAPPVVQDEVQDETLAPTDDNAPVNDYPGRPEWASEQTNIFRDGTQPEPSDASPDIESQAQAELSPEAQSQEPANATQIPDEALEPQAPEETSPEPMPAEQGDVTTPELPDGDFEQGSDAQQDAASTLPEADQDVIQRKFGGSDKRPQAIQAFSNVKPDTANRREALAMDIEINGDRGDLAAPRVEILDGLRQSLNASKPFRSKLSEQFPAAEQRELIPSVSATSSRSLNILSEAVANSELNEAVDQAARRVSSGENRAAVIKDLKQELMNYGGEAGATRAEVSPGVSDLAADQTALPQSEEQEVFAVRGQGDNSTSGMGGELQDILRGNRGAPQQRNDGGTDPQRQRVRAGEREVGPDSRSGQEQAEQRVADAPRQNNDPGGLGERAGDGQGSTEGQAERVRMDSRESPDNTPEQSEKDQQNADAQGQDAVDGRLGQRNADELQDAQEQNKQPGVERGESANDASGVNEGTEGQSIKWEKDGKRLWRSDDGQIITDESFTSGGVRSKFFPVYASNEARQAGDNYTSGESLSEAKSKAVRQDREASMSRDGEFRRTPEYQRDALTVEQAESIRDDLMNGWKGAPDVIVRDQIDQFPPGLQAAIRMAGAENDMRGVFWNDTVYILASRIPDRMRMEQVILHEVIGHYGLRKMLGGDMDRVLNQIWAAHGGKTRADFIIKRYFPGNSFDVNNKEHRHTVAEELIAHLAEQNRGQTLVQRAVAIIREGLRKLGFTIEFTVDDIVNLLRKARETVENGGFETDTRTEGAAVAASKYSKAGRSGSDRTTWPADFPRVPFAAPLGAADKHPRYAEAKSGDVNAAKALVDDIVNDAAIERIRGMIGDRKPIVVPVNAKEATGNNRIPAAYAAKIAKAVGLETQPAIVQSVSAQHTNSGADHRLANHAVFDGPVEAGREYLIVDDTMTMGGTLAGLRGHIEANGGKVIGATTLTGFGKDGQLALGEKMRQDLWRKHGAPLDEYLKEEFGYGIDSLTQGEAGHFRKAVSLDAIRDRIAAARLDQGDGGTDGVSQDEPRFSLAGNRLDHAADHFDDLDADQRSALGKIAPKTPKEKASDWLAERLDRWATKLRQGIVDRFAALKDVDEALYGQDVVEGSTASSSWVLAQMSGAASGALQSMLTTSRIKLNRKEGVITLRDDSKRGLNDTLKQLGTAAEIERFFGWIAGNRSARLMEDGRENLFTPEEVNALKRLNEGKTESGQSRKMLYSKVFRQFQEFRDDVLEIAAQTGIITQEQRETWANEFYVPFYRLADNEGGFTGPKSSGGITRQEAYKRLKGGKENLNDLLENTMMNFHHLLQASLKNQAALQAMENSEDLGIAREVREADRTPENSTFVLRDGRKIWYEIDDPLVFKAVSALAHPGMNSTMLNVMRKFKRLFTNMTTTTPSFILRNLIRDTLQALATSPVSMNPVKNAMQGAKVYGNGRTRAQMMASGGSFSFGHLYGENADELRIQITGSLGRADVLRNPSMVPAAVKTLWRSWNNVTDFTENMNRAAIYNQNLKERGELYAAFQARDLMNFSQYGSWPAVRILIDVVPFLNARLQGLDKIYRTGVKPVFRATFGKGNATDAQIAKRFWAVAGTLALVSIANYLRNYDDEEYQRLEEWEKDTYWHVRIRSGEGGFIRIPKPFEVGAIATLSERVTEQFVNDKATGKLFRQRLGHMLTDTFAFSPVPQIGAPFLDIYSNYDAFTGRPIESLGMQRTRPSLRYRPTTTTPAKWASEGMEVILGPDNSLTLSPVQIDHLIRGYLGSVGAWTTGVADTIIKTAQGETEPEKYWYEYNPIRVFYKNLGDEEWYTRYGTVFYDALKEVNRVHADIQKYRELEKYEAADELRDKNLGILALRRKLNRTQKDLSEINKRMDRVNRAQKSAEWKRRELDRYKEIRNRIQEQAGRLVEEVRAKED